MRLISRVSSLFSVTFLCILLNNGYIPLKKLKTSIYNLADERYPIND